MRTLQLVGFGRFYANMLQVADTSNGTTHYYHEDALGSIRLVTTGAVNITFSSNYAPFGQAVNTTGIEEFQYTDKPADAITGLYYFGAGFYDPAIGRFITEDCHFGTAK
jgi:RHS repeat-associated protein